MRPIDADALITELKDRFGIYPACVRKAIENAPAADVEPVVYGKWIISPYNDDGFKHHMCSQCETDAPFYYIYATQYDEGIDGEWFELGEIEDDIVEFIGKRCHECGAKMS